MTLEEFRNTINTRPFRPFTIHLADGRSMPVRSHEYIARSPTGRTFAVYDDEGRFSIIDLLLVTELKLEAENGSKARKKK
jgi:hypothetical protein